MRAPITQRYRESNTDTSVLTDYATSSYPRTLSEVKLQTWDSITENWKKRRDNGEIIINDYRNIRTEITDKPCYNSFVDELGNHTGGLSSTHFWVGVVGNLPADPSVDVDTLIDLAVTDAHANINSSEAQLLVTLAEARKTQSLIKGLCTDIAYYMRQGVQIKRKLRANLLTASEAANRWLQFRYGLRPLLHDLASLRNAYQEIGKSRYTTYYGYATGEDTNAQSGVWTTQSSSWDYSIRYRHTKTQAVSCRAGVIVQNYGPTSRGVADTFGLTDLFGTAWELVPYSFVIDFVFNTSKFINAWSPSFTTAIQGSFVTIRDEVTSFSDIGPGVENPGGASPGDFDHTIEASVSGDYMDYVRTTTRLANPDLPSLPTWNNRLTAAKMIDILALLYSFTSKSSRQDIRI